MNLVNASAVIKTAQFATLWAIGGVIFAGCASSYTSPLVPPVERAVQSPFAWSQLPSGGTASIGDRIFWVRRYVTGARESVAPSFAASPKLFPFPANSVWSRTHTYENEDGHGLFVYTTPDYYRGNIGVILDSDDNVATRAPMVQVRGGKNGRRWTLKGSGKFFVVPDHLVDQWGVRYGGRRGDNYAFEIVDFPNPSVSQVTQSLQITRAEFFAGFTVKGVFIKGVDDLGSGIIKYSLRDDRVDK